MRYLLDTCTTSEFARPRPNEGLVEWLRRQDEAGQSISVLAMGEVVAGIERVTDPNRRATLRNWLERDLAERFAGRIVPIDAAVARVWGALFASAAASL